MLTLFSLTDTAGTRNVAILFRTAGLAPVKHAAELSVPTLCFSATADQGISGAEQPRVRRIILSGHLDFSRCCNQLVGLTASNMKVDGRQLRIAS